MSTPLLERPPVIDDDVVEQIETSDEPGQSAHIVLLPVELREVTTPQAYVFQARIEGTEVEALCGHRWIPARDPRALPVCSRCKAIFEHDPHGHGDRDKLPED